jgi:pilus assembly protein Flp/PilA
MAIINRFVKEEAGQDIVEYGILVAGIAVAAVAAITLLTPALSSLWARVGSRLATN